MLCSCLAASVVSSASCSAADVQAAINTAASGDVVQVPPGTCTWTSNVVISGKAIVLQGAGAGQTTILNGEKDPNGTLIINSNSAQNVRLTGFTFQLNDTAADSGLKWIVVGGSWTDKLVRIDHSDFVGNGNWAYLSAIDAHAYVLVDHCNFNNIRKDCIHVFGDPQSSWQTADSMGSARNHFFEDCTVTSIEPNAAFLDAYEGARYVIRHNVFIDTPLVNHGECTSNPGVRHYEIYNNVFRLGSNWSARGWVPDNWMLLRGGTGLIFNNTFDDLPWQKGEVKLAEYKIGVDGTVCGQVGPNWCACNYPASQQIGRGENNASDPMYFWANLMKNPTYDGSLSFSLVGDDGRCDSICQKPINVQDYIADGRDYFSNSQKPGYTPYTYPHPLTQTTAGSSPSPPSNLRIVA